MISFDDWYSEALESEGKEDVTLREAFQAGRESMLDTEAVKQARDILANPEMVWDAQVLRKLIARLIP